MLQALQPGIQQLDLFGGALGSATVSQEQPTLKLNALAGEALRGDADDYTVSRVEKIIVLWLRQFGRPVTAPELIKLIKRYSTVINGKDGLVYHCLRMLINQGLIVLVEHPELKFKSYQITDAGQHSLPGPAFNA